MTVIGIDPSMNSTGICICKDGIYKYVLLSTKPTKKMLSAAEGLKNLRIVQVDKEPSAPGVEGAINQTINIAHILKYVEFFLDMNKPKYVIIEAPAFNASGRVADLAGLNHAIRLACLQRNIKFYPLPPTTVKAATVGNGQATKEMMIQTWLKLFPEYSLLESMKVDDLADAWALCNFPVENYGR